MASLNVLTIDAEGRAVDFEVWLDDLQLFLQCDSKDGLSLFDLTSGASTAPTADADSTVRSQWLTRDAAARLAVRNHLPSTERAHFSQYKSTRALYNTVVARYSSPTTAALSRLMLPYPFPDLAAFSTVTNLVAHLRTSDACYRAALPTEFLPTNSPPMYITLYYLVTCLPDSLSSVTDHFLSLCPTELTVDLPEERLAAAEKSNLAVGASRGDRRTPFFEGCSPVPLLPSVASAAAVDLVGTEEVGAASAPSGRRRTGKGKGSKGGGGGTCAPPLAAPCCCVLCSLRCPDPARPANCAAMASLRVLAFDHEGRPIQLDTWLDDLQVYLLSDSRDSVLLFDHTSGASPAPPTTADSATRSQWLTRDAAARLAICNHLLLAECAHFGQHRTAHAMYGAVVARYSSPATAALGRLLLPYLFPELSAFATVEDLVTHLRTSNARYRATLPAEFLDRNPPRSLTVDLLKQHLLAAETSVVVVGAARGTPRTPFFEGCSPSPLAPSYALAAAVDVLGAEDVGAASASGKRRSSKGKGGRGGGGGSRGGGGGSSGGGGGNGGGGGGGSGGGSGGFGGSGGGSGGGGSSGGSGSGGGQAGATQRRGSCGGQRQQQQQQQRRSETPSPQQLREWISQRGASGELLRSRVAIFDLDYDAILAAMYALSVSAEGDCYLCVPPDPGIEAAALGASDSALPGTAPAEALHTFTLDSGASRCFFRDSTTLTPHSAPVPIRLADPSEGAVVARSSTVLPCPTVPSGSLSVLPLPSFSTNLVSTAALQDAMVTTTTPRGQRVLICTYTPTGRHLATFTRRPWSLPPLPPSPALPCLPCIEGRQRAAPHSSSFPPTTAPLQTLHMDVRGPARVLDRAASATFCWLLTTTRVTPRSSPCAAKRFRQDLPVLRLHSDRGGEFSFDLLQYFCRGEGILQTFTLPASPQQNGIAERRIGLVMEPRVSLPETSLTLRWTGKVGDASVFRIRGSRAFVRDTSADKLSARAIPCGPAPSGVSQVDPPPRTVPVEVAVDSGAESEGAGSEGAELGGAEPRGAEPAGVELGGAEPEGVEPGGAESEGAESGGAEPWGIASSGGPAGASPRLSPRPEPLSLQQLREWFAQRTRLRSGAAGAGDTGAGGAGVSAGAGGTRVGGAGAGDPAEPGGAGAGGAGARGTGAGGAGARGAGASDTGAVGAGSGGNGTGGAGAGGVGVGGTGAVDPGTRSAGARGVVSGGTGAGGTVRPRPFFVPLLRQPGSPLPAPSPYAEQTDSFTKRREPESRPASPVCAVRAGRRVPRPRPPPVPGTHTMALRPSSVPQRFPLPTPPESSLLAVPDPESDLACAASPAVSRLLATVVTDPSFESTAAFALVAELVDYAVACRLDYATALVAESESSSPPSVGGECSLGTDVLEDRHEDFECLAAAVPHFASMLLAPEGVPDAPDILAPRSYAEVITGPYSSQWQTAMDAEMAS
ncbi:unnamed protein product [Closterium sp. NIES-54]